MWPSGARGRYGYRQEVRAPDSVELRRIALAVSVLDDIDIVPLDDGVMLAGEEPVEVSWLELRRALPAPTPRASWPGHGSARGCSVDGSPSTATSTSCASWLARSASLSTTPCTPAWTGSGTGCWATPWTWASASSESATTPTR